VEKRVSFIFDPRTKLFILLLCVIAASISPSLEYNLGLVLLVGITGMLCGKRQSAVIGIAGYVLLYALTIWAAGMTGTLKTTLLAAFGLFHKVYACGMMGGFQQPTQQPAPAQPAQPEQTAPQEDPVAKLKQMKELLDAGVVSQEEFDTLKKRLLGL